MDRPYTCLLCGKVFRGTSFHIGCSVNHNPGTCCHYGDTEVVKRTKATNSTPEKTIRSILWNALDFSDVRTYGEVLEQEQDRLTQALADIARIIEESVLRAKMNEYIDDDEWYDGCMGGIESLKNFILERIG